MTVRAIAILVGAFFTTAALAAGVDPGQIMAGEAFELFAGDTDRICPARQLRTITPGDLSWEQETFAEHLSSSQTRRLASANQDRRICAHRNGLSCSTTQTLAAMQRTGMLTAFARFACDHPAPTAVIRHPAAYQPQTGAAADILQHLDLNSFSNSTGPRRQPLLHTPAEYGFRKLERFDDGWSQLSQAEDRWHLSALVLDRRGSSATICFIDAGGNGATYRSTQVLQVALKENARWTATQVGDRSDCRNDPPLVGR